MSGEVYKVTTDEQIVDRARQRIAAEIADGVGWYVAQRQTLLDQIARYDDWLTAGINPLHVDPSASLGQLAASLDTHLARVQAANSIGRAVVSKDDQAKAIQAAAAKLATHGDRGDRSNKIRSAGELDRCFVEATVIDEGPHGARAWQRGEDGRWSAASRLADSRSSEQLWDTATNLYLAYTGSTPISEGN